VSIADKNSDNTARNNDLLKKLYQKFQETKAENEALKQNLYQEPIAIIGVGCRFPDGVDSLFRFSEKLHDTAGWTVGSPAQRPFFGPAEAHWQGCFVDNVDFFDADFFGLSAREAAETDPQQRLLLETAYKAVEDARYPMASLKGQSVGVFVGMSTDDYQQCTVASGQPNVINAFNTLGTARSVAAGRIAYCFDFHGPALQIDTACSSSLMAVHLACQSLRQRESTMALAGGVNLLLAPDTYVTRDAMGALSPTGKCHTFSDLADGYARSEGCGFVVLKTLSSALKDKDRIYSVIYASAVNHDGRSNGLTAPNGEAQRQLMLASLKSAGLQAHQIDYVETHGTGTRLGDPIELHALGETLAKSRPHPLWVGSLKSQLGHLEAAAGIAALIKTTALFVDEHLSPEPVIARHNPLINWDKYNIAVVDQQIPWKQTSTQLRYAAINAFGLSGTNVNVIVGDAPVAATQPQTALHTEHYFLCVSGKTERALLRNVFAFEQALKLSDSINNFLLSSCVHKDHFEYRTIFSYSDKAQLLVDLNHAKQITHTPAKLGQFAFIFTAGAPQDAQLLSELYFSWPLFKHNIDQLIAPGCDLNPASLPATLASVLLQVALANIYSILGIKPQYLVCTRDGLLAAAYFAQLLSLQQLIQLHEQRTAFTHNIAMVDSLDGLVSPTYSFVVAKNAAFETSHELNANDFAQNQYADAVVTELPFDILLWLAQPQPVIPNNNLVNKSQHIFAVTKTSVEHHNYTQAIVDFYRLGANVNFAALYGDAIASVQRSAPAYEFDREPLWTRAAAPTETHVVTEVQRYALEWQPLPIARPAKINNLLIIHCEELTESVVSAISESAWHYLYISHIDPIAIAAVTAQFSGPFEIVDLRFLNNYAHDFSYSNCLHHLELIVTAVQCVVSQPAHYHLVLPSLDSCADYVPLLYAPIRGFLRSISHEHPAHIGSLSICEQYDLDTLLKAIPSLAAYEFLSFSESELRVERLLRVHENLLLPDTNDVHTNNRQNYCAQENDALWITGGLGSLGLALAKQRASTGTRQLLLTSRTIHIDVETALILAEIRSLGATIFIASVDVSDTDAIEKLAARFGQDLPNITGVVHAAGASEFCALEQLTSHELHKICAAKIAGAWNIHCLSQRLQFKHFIVYSSIASVWGSAQLSHYAAANAFLDALIAQRCTQGLPAVVVNWGPWAKIGMAARDARQDVQAWGLLPLAAETLTPVITAMFARRQWAQVVCNIDSERFQAMLESRHKVPLLTHIFTLPALAANPINTTAIDASITRPFADLSGKARVNAILRVVAEQIATLLNRPSEKALSRSQPLHEMGVDSLMAVDVTRALSAFFNYRLPATLIFDYPSIQAVSEFIHSTIYPIEHDKDEVLNSREEAELLRALQNLSIDLLDEITDGI
jgi:acyl transferase domain-containing protein/acyl carrier protein